MNKFFIILIIIASIVSIFFGMVISNYFNPLRRFILLESFEKEDRKFFDDLNSKRKDLGELISLYKGFAILGRRDLIYDLRDEDYRKIVSREVERTLGPKNQIFEGVFFDSTRFSILEDYAKFGVIYFKRDHNGNDSMIMVDEYWMYDKVEKKWNFLSSPYNGKDVLGRDTDITNRFTSIPK